MKEKPSQFLIALAVYCKLLLWKYSHVSACAAVHVIAFWQKCKNTSAFKMKSKGCFFLQMKTFSAWLLVEISFVLLQLTSWQSCHLYFSSHKIGIKQMLLGFFSDIEPFLDMLLLRIKRISCKLSHFAVGMLMYLSNPINQPISMQTYSKRCHCCCNREVNWRFF